MNGTQENRKSESAPSANPLTSISRERLTQEKLREMFDYHEDGTLTRRTSRQRVHIGDIVGTARSDGRLQVCVSYRRYLVHRIVWLWHFGYFPEAEIDHINRDPTDNRIENLREVGRQCNQRNTGNYATNASGVKGVCWNERYQKWRAYINLSKRTIFLGLHDDFLEAACHRLAAEQSIGWGSCGNDTSAFQFVSKRVPNIK